MLMSDERRYDCIRCGISGVVLHTELGGGDGKKSSANRSVLTGSPRLRVSRALKL
jgi:hypothetical protein